MKLIVVIVTDDRANHHVSAFSTEEKATDWIMEFTEEMVEYGMCRSDIYPDYKTIEIDSGDFLLA